MGNAIDRTEKSRQRRRMAYGGRKFVANREERERERTIEKVDNAWLVG